METNSLFIKSFNAKTLHRTTLSGLDGLNCTLRRLSIVLPSDVRHKELIREWSFILLDCFEVEATRRKRMMKDCFLSSG
jgi:hypothetical protein